MSSSPEEKKEEQKPEAEIVHAFYVVYNRKKNEYGVIGSPGFFDDEQRGVFAAREVVRLVDKFYADKKRLGSRIITSARNFTNKLNFRRFVRSS